MRTQTKNIPAATPLLPDTGRLLDVEEAALYLGTSVRFPRRLVEERRVRFFRVGRHIRFAKSDLDAFLAANSTPAAS